MSLRSSLLAPLLASAALAAPAAAGDRLLVAGAAGFVMQTDVSVDALEYFTCFCNGPIVALAATESHLYVADELGSVLRFDARSGWLQGFFFPGVGTIAALAASRGDVFLGTADGFVLRLDGRSGATLGSRSVPAGVRALLVEGGFLFAATADGAVYRAPLDAGAFEYFTCFCFTNIQGMTVALGDLFIVDELGTVVRADLQTGELLNAFGVGPTNSIAAHAGELFFYYEGGGNISRFDAETGAVLPGGFTSPVDVQAMLVLVDERSPGLTQRRKL